VENKKNICYNCEVYFGAFMRKIIFLLFFTTSMLFSQSENLKVIETIRAVTEQEITKKGFSIIDQIVQEDALKEQSEQRKKGCYDDSCLVDTGKMLAAQRLFLVDINKLGEEQFLFKIRYVSVESGETINSESELFEGKLSDYSKLFKFSKDFVTRIFGDEKKSDKKIPVLLQVRIISEEEVKKAIEDAKKKAEEEKKMEEVRKAELAKQAKLKEEEDKKNKITTEEDKTKVTTDAEKQAKMIAKMKEDKEEKAKQEAEERVKQEKMMEEIRLKELEKQKQEEEKNKTENNKTTDETKKVVENDDSDKKSNLKYFNIGLSAQMTHFEFPTSSADAEDSRNDTVFTSSLEGKFVCFDFGRFDLNVLKGSVHFGVDDFVGFGFGLVDGGVKYAGVRLGITLFDYIVLGNGYDLYMSFSGANLSYTYSFGIVDLSAFVDGKFGKKALGKEEEFGWIINFGLKIGFSM